LFLWDENEWKPMPAAVTAATMNAVITPIRRVSYFQQRSWFAHVLTAVTMILPIVINGLCHFFADSKAQQSSRETIVTGVIAKFC
jgi:hypothetical protein